MTITLYLASDLEEAVERKAHMLGISPSEYVLRLTEKATRPQRKMKSAQSADIVSRPRTAADLVDALESLGLPAEYGDPSLDSPELARQLAERFSRPIHNPAS